MSNYTVILSANRGYAFTSSRIDIIKRFVASGWRVVLATADDSYSRSIESMGVVLEPVIFNRGGLVLVDDLKAYWRLSAIYNQYKPLLIHHFHAKPVIFGSIAARRVLSATVTTVNTITGLGNAFEAGGITANLAARGYAFAGKCSDSMVFQNRDDKKLFLERGWVSSDQARLIIGSGVDLEQFEYIDRHNHDNNSPMIVMLGRLLKQKGVPAFAEVAWKIQQDYPDARFVLAGEVESKHPDAIEADWLEAHSEIEYVGQLTDIRPLLSEADILLFPSSYREGVPRVLMEAAATGLPAVALDVPGVREAVRHNETGYLVPINDIDTLTSAVRHLLQDSGKRLAMGQAARQLAEQAFDSRDITEQYLNIYRELGISQL